jgi:hypothetical protein
VAYAAGLASFRGHFRRGKRGRIMEFGMFHEFREALDEAMEQVNAAER